MQTMRPKFLNNSVLLKIVFLLFAFLFCMSFQGCKKQIPSPSISPAPEQSAQLTSNPNWSHPRSDERISERRAMVRHISDFYGLKDTRVLEAMENVPRHWFVGPGAQAFAYEDTPLPIGHSQTISQPFMVAYMTDVLKLDKDHKVLEIGTGSGYQAAVLTEFTPNVFTIEIIEPLGTEAKRIFEKRGYSTVKVRIGDGYKGWSEQAPFDAIIVTCAPENIPQPLIHQLRPGGKMVIPVGKTFGVQELVVVTKDEKSKLNKKSLMPVRFVPMLRDSD